MDSRAPVSSLCLFRETQTDLEPAYPGSVIQIQVPSNSTFIVKPRQQRRILRSAPTCNDEDSYNKHHLAISSSFYFGRVKRYPRSFLWRVLQEGRVLELRSVDLSKKNGETREASYIIQLHFASAIKPNGVALTDTEEQDSLSVFAITRANDLYTLTIRKDFFCHAAASEEDVSRWCKIARPATFSISIPHSLIAGNSQLLIVSLSDGRLLQLTRKKEDDGSKWHESTYGDGQWTASLRGLVRWQGSNTVKYDGTALEQGTATAMAISPDKSHLFAVCLNHTLRIWNPTKAASVFSKDLLWQHREPHETSKLMLDPGSPNVLQVFETYRPLEGDLYYAVTFSPHDLGQFKFWGIRDPDHGDSGVRDLFPDCSFKPPDPDPSPESKAIWKVADFNIKGAQRGQQLEIWVLMRSNRRHKLYNLKFDLEDLHESWQNSWTNTATETFSDQPAPQISDLEPEDAADKWLDYITCPGKYPETVLETALAIYCSERAISLPNPKASLKERMCAAITLQVDATTGEIDVTKYHKASDQEWTVLWQDIRDLDRSRWQVSSLAYDGYAEIPYIAFANGAAAIRTCDKVEIISLNTSAVLAKSVGMLEAPSIEMEQGMEPKLPDELAVIVSAAAIFRQNCNYGLLQKCSTVLAEELWLDPSFSVPLRIEAFYDRCNFTEEVGKDHFERLEDSLHPIGGFGKLDTETLLSVLDELSHRLPPESSGLSHTTFGQRMLINGAQDVIASRERLLFDLLIMIVFVDMDIHRDEIPMEKFDGPRIYVELLDQLRQYQIMQWLATNIRAEKNKDTPPPATSKVADMYTLNNERNTISTVLENLFALHLPPQSHDTQSQCEALTHTIQDLLQWVLGGNEQIGLDEVRVYIQCNLLANNNLDLATDFLRYQPSTDWSTYIKGRLYLLKGDCTSAAIYFKKAAFKLSRPSTFDYPGASHSLLSPMDALSFSNGLPTYYTHILNLFDASSFPTQMAHFAHLALQLAPPSSKPSEQSLTLLTSLFQASLQITDFSTAFSALTRHPQPKTLLPSFISALLSSPTSTPLLLSLPFPPNLHTPIDDILSARRIKTNIPPKVLAAWRIKHNNFRGAAAALLPSLQAERAKNGGRRGGGWAGGGRDREGLEEMYLGVINLLCCAGEENQWVLSEGAQGGEGRGRGRRGLVRVGDIREWYQGELDRWAVIEGGRFGFGGAGAGGDDVTDGGEVDEMDVF